MGTLLDALLKLQSIERELAQVRRRLTARQRVVKVQEKRIEEIQQRADDLQQQIQQRRRLADERELDLSSREEQISRLRVQLQAAKTNKEYAAILTQINTLKADNSKIEEESLSVLSEVDELKKQADELTAETEKEGSKLEEIRDNSSQEIERLNGMYEKLQAQRAEAAKGLSADSLAVFERVAERYEGDAMAPIEQHGRKPPYRYVCGGCFMNLNAEHANALRVHDELRTCDSCGRILYIDENA